MKAPLRLLLVHEQPLLLEGLVLALGRTQDMQVVLAAHSVCDAMEHLSAVRVDVALVSLGLPGTSAMDFCREGAKVQAHMRVALLATHADVGTLMDAMQAGAAALLFTDMQSAELLAALRRLRTQWSVFDAALERFAGALRGRVTPRRARAPDLAAGNLSERETEILRLVSQGQSNKEIASLLQISTSTVANHLKSAYRKLGVSDRTEAVVAAMGRGLL